MPLSLETLRCSTPLQPANEKNHIRLFDTHPNLLVRTNQKISTNENTIKQYTTEQKILVDDIKRFGIHVPHYFASNGSIFPEINSPMSLYAAHTVVSLVNPMNIDDIYCGSREDTRFTNAIRETYSNLIRYCKDAVDKKKPVLSDIFTLDQWVYGNTKYDTQNKLYLVDIENKADKLSLIGHLENLDMFALDIKYITEIDLVDLQQAARQTFNI